MQACRNRCGALVDPTWKFCRYCGIQFPILPPSVKYFRIALYTAAVVLVWLLGVINVDTTLTRSGFPIEEQVTLIIMAGFIAVGFLGRGWKIRFYIAGVAGLALLVLIGIGAGGLENADLSRGYLWAICGLMIFYRVLSKGWDDWDEIEKGKDLAIKRVEKLSRSKGREFEDGLQKIEEQLETGKFDDNVKNKLVEGAQRLKTKKAGLAELHWWTEFAEMENRLQGWGAQTPTDKKQWKDVEREMSNLTIQLGRFDSEVEGEGGSAPENKTAREEKLRVLKEELDTAKSRFALLQADPASAPPAPDFPLLATMDFEKAYLAIDEEYKPPSKKRL